MFPRLRAHLRLSLGTAVLLALSAGLSVGVYVLSERLRVAETRVKTAEAWREKLYTESAQDFYNRPNQVLRTGLYNLLANSSTLKSALWDARIPERTDQRGTVLIFGRNPEDQPGYHGSGSQHSYQENPFLCFADLDREKPCPLMFRIDPAYRFVSVQVAHDWLCVTLARAGVDLPWTVRLELPDLDQPLEAKTLFHALESQMHLIDPEYHIMYPDPIQEEAPILVEPEFKWELLDSD